jgi:hypothetical protein
VRWASRSLRAARSELINYVVLRICSVSQPECPRLPGRIAMQGWLVSAKIPIDERRDVTVRYVAAVDDGGAAIEAVRRRIIFRNDERLEVVRPATESELRGLRTGAVKNWQ